VIIQFVVLIFTDLKWFRSLYSYGKNEFLWDVEKDN